MTHIHSRAKALLMLDELHRLGFEQLRFATLGGHRTHIYAARDEAHPDQKDPRFIPAPRRFTTPMFGHEPVARDFLASKWDVLFRGELKPNHLAGMFLLDFPDIARNGFGPDEPYRNWFRALRPRLQQGQLPITHPRDDFMQPYRELQWHYANEAFSYPGPPPNPHHEDKPVIPVIPELHHYDKQSVRALLMLNELHRFGFEALRFHSYGHGWISIFAAQDEAGLDTTDPRFLPASRRFNVLMPGGGMPAWDTYSAHRWEQLLTGTMRPNHLAGLFVLDYPDVAGRGFGADERYRQWFRGMQGQLKAGMLPFTHVAHAQPRRQIGWGNYGDQPEPGRPVEYPGPPENPFLSSGSEMPV